jgi:hypothetical protein
MRDGNLDKELSPRLPDDHIGDNVAKTALEHRIVKLEISRPMFRQDLPAQFGCHCRYPKAPFLGEDLLGDLVKRCF